MIMRNPMKHDGDSLSHALTMIHMHLGNTQYHLTIHDGYMDDIAKAIEDKVFLDPESLEAIQLHNDAAELFKLASDLTSARAKLIANMPAKPKFLAAAE